MVISEIRSLYCNVNNLFDALADYNEGETYTFTVSVRAIGRYSDNRKQQSIHTDLVEE